MALGDAQTTERLEEGVAAPAHKQTRQESSRGGSFDRPSAGPFASGGPGYGGGGGGGGPGWGLGQSGSSIELVTYFITAGGAGASP